MTWEIDPHPYTINLGRDTFEHDVVQASHDSVVVVFFWAPWCRLCRQLIPQIRELMDESEGESLLALADVRELRDLGRQLGMRGLPSIFAYRDGEMVDYIHGSPPLGYFEAWLVNLLDDEHSDDNDVD